MYFASHYICLRFREEVFCYFAVVCIVGHQMSVSAARKIDAKLQRHWIKFDFGYGREIGEF